MPDRKQLKFHRYLVVNVTWAAVFPAKNEKDAKRLEEYMASSGDQVFTVDARWDDDARLFWSGTTAGHSIDR